MNPIRTYINLIESIRLDERIFGNNAVVFHRTKHIENIEDISTQGFMKGVRGLYGSGIYTTYSFKSQMTNYMRKHYGRYIIRSKIHLKGLLILDYELAKSVYGSRYTLVEQFQDLKLSYKNNRARNDGHMVELRTKWIREYSEKLETAEFSSDIAKELTDISLANLKGIVYTGRNDGECVVLFDEKLISPLAYTDEGFDYEYDEDSYDDEPEYPMKDENEFSWTKIISKEFIQQKVTPPAAYDIKDPNTYDDDTMEMITKIRLKRLLRDIKINPDAILTSPIRPKEALALALKLKPSLIFEIPFDVFNAKVAVLNDPNILNKLLSTDSWKNARNFQKSDFIKWLADKNPKIALDQLLQNEIPSHQVYEAITKIAINSFGQFKRMVDNDLVTNWFDYIQNIIEKLDQDNTLLYINYIIKNRTTNLSENQLRIIRYNLGKDQTLELNLSKEEREFILNL